MFTPFIDARRVAGRPIRLLVADNLHDIFVDGFIARTFSPQGAHDFFTVFLRTPDYLRYCRILYSGGLWYTTQNAHHVPRPSPGIPTHISPLSLDFSVRTTQGTVVPQPRWVPADEVEARRHVHDATLQLPIFFVNRNNGAVGFLLPDILQGRDGDLHNRNSHASLGGRSTTHIRMNVSSHSYISCGGSHLCSPTPLTSGRATVTGSAKSPHETKHSIGIRLQLAVS